MRLTREAFETCRERALSLLDRRAHSLGEIRCKLRTRGFEEPLVALVADDLQRSGLVSDPDFAVAFCEERLRSSRPAGPARLKADLLRRHVAAEVAEEAVRTAMAQSGHDSEYQSALAAGRRKWQALRARPSQDSRKDRERLLRFLAGRGFSGDVCRRVIERVERGEEE
jgi:regulatory protein